MVRSYVESNKVSTAVKLLLGKYSRDPTNPSVANNLGVALLRLGKVNEAKKFLVEAVSKSQRDVALPNGMIPLLNLSTLLLRQEDFRNSELVLRDVIAMNFDDLDLESDVWIRHLEALSGLGKEQESVSQATDMLKRWRKSPLAFSRVATFLLHQYSTVNKDSEQAVTLAMEILGGIARSSTLDARTKRQVLNNAIFSLLVFDRLDLATLHIDVLNPFLRKDPFVTATFGLFNLRRGRLDKGMQCYDLAVHLTDDARQKRRFRQRMNIELGRFYLRGGELGRAARALEKATAEQNGLLYVWTPSRICRDSVGVNVRFLGWAFSSNVRL